ncbi:hypothetical protein [Candidatus Chloroploca asiatica]|uniref:Uncharacterized protein n=1 Tax=Candidatus Chloroploca asiatica TaxID=1506545 RepID=A0A2H3KG33_9CHLR|nr:hypothetical protein [Candidatus Chloroploca asiatica]PDV96649.1 hypothetical protein A9Q02_22670 [Candidatus Chloroploca asiatica]
MSPADRADLAWFFQTYGDAALALIPTTVPHREHAALLGALLLRHTSRGAERLPTYVTTATDVLRLAVALSDGDVSLANPTKFRSFARAERRLLLERLEACGSIIEDMLRYPEPWKRLGERLHPGEYQARFPQSAAAFEVIRNDRPVATFRSKVEGAIAAGQIDAALTLSNGERKA